MALLPDVHVNLDRPTIQHIYQLFVPLVPGGAFVTGFVLARPDCLAYFAAASGLGYYSRIAAMIFVAYVAGLLLYALSVHFGSILSLCVSYLVGRNEKLRPTRINTSTSQTRTWRSVASTFLGEQLVPPPPDGGSMYTTSAHFAPPISLEVQNHDTAWNDWYIILQDYLLRGTPVLTPDALFFWTIVQATSWAVIIMSVYSCVGWHHPVVLFVLALLVLLTALVPFGAQYLYLKYDRLAPADFIARLLAEIRAREDAIRRGEGAPLKPQS